MGSGGSHLGGSRRHPPRPHHHNQLQRRRRRTRPGFKRVLTSVFVCGASPPTNPHLEMEDHPAEKLVNSLGHDKKIQSANRTIETGRNIGDGPRRAHMVDKGKCLSENKELVLDPESIANGRVNEASTSYEDQHSPQSESANGRANPVAVEREIYLMDGNVQQSYARSIQSGLPSLGEHIESLADGVESSMSELMSFHDCETSSTSAHSTSTTDDTFLRGSPSGLSFLMTDRDGNHRDGNLLQLDVVSASSNLPSSGASELSPHEARRNSRRLFWDAFSRSSRRNADSRSSVFTSDDSDGLDAHDRWLLDFNTDFVDNELRSGSRLFGNNNQNPNEHRWHSSSEIWERFRDVGRNGIDRRTATTCPSGIHPNGACSCGSMIRAEESGARASISRIVMLAEALFEVLDEIHRQPTSVSSVVSLPAPESVVDSLPMKDHKKLEISENGDGVAQCYICLADYEEGDKIRILPCHHEFHMSCVDKWLKEMHGVCPLCRGDVCEGLNLRECDIPGSALL